jgi:hypothetical protein
LARVLQLSAFPLQLVQPVALHKALQAVQAVLLKQVVESLVIPVLVNLSTVVKLSLAAWGVMDPLLRPVIPCRC